MTRVDALYLLLTGHLLRILIPLEEPPHLTADFRALTLRDHISAPPGRYGILMYFRKEIFVIKKIIQKNTLPKAVPIRV